MNHKRIILAIIISVLFISSTQAEKIENLNEFKEQR